MPALGCRQRRHGHKTAARGFDGYKGHLAIDPDSEIITATTAGPGNTGDADAVAALLAADLPAAEPDGAAADSDTGAEVDEPGSRTAQADRVGDAGPGGQPLAVYGDAAYGSGAVLATLEAAGADIRTKVQPPVSRGGLFSKDRFTVDLPAGTVTCPNRVQVPIRPAEGGGGLARFGAVCADCPLLDQCTTARAGRTISVGPYEAELVRARTRQACPDWVADYRATRPKVERKIAHLMRRRHGGRRARVRGRTKVAADFSLLAAAVNLARLGVLGVRFNAGPGPVMATA